MTVSTLKKKLVFQAIQVLRELNDKHYEDSSKKKPLLEDEGKSTLYLQVMLKKIPKSKLTKLIKVNLPHSLVKDSDEVCLITGDLDKKNHKAEIEPDVLHYKALLNKHGVTQISEVMTLRQLRTEYKPYEAKQKLLAAYDVFLADNKIAECLPRVLGKHFFKKRKLPIQINLKTSNLKQQIEKTLSTKLFYITGQGNSCSSEVAYLDMADTEILENIMAMAEALSKNFPGTWGNVMGIYLKTAKSKAIPLYVSYDSPNSIQLPEEKEEDDVVIDELSTIPNMKVKVLRSGKVQAVRYEEDLEDLSDEQTLENDTEKNNEDVITQGQNECSDTEKFGKKFTKQVKSKKKSSEEKRKNMKQKPISPNQSQIKATQEESEEETKSRKQGKKNTKQKLFSSDQSLQQVESSHLSNKTTLKRKRSQPAVLNSDQSFNDNETPMQATKRRKLEGINMKRNQALKESKKNRKKKNQSRTKQRL